MTKNTLIEKNSFSWKTALEEAVTGIEKRVINMMAKEYGGRMAQPTPLVTGAKYS